MKGRNVERKRASVPSVSGVNRRVRPVDEVLTSGKSPG
jgi:hypothetical protein